jgi:hypothetical protein
LLPSNSAVFARHAGAAKLDDLAVLDGFDPPSLFLHRVSANRQKKDTWQAKGTHQAYAI